MTMLSIQIDSWLDFSHLYLKNTQDLLPSLTELNRAIGQASFLVGSSVTLADFSVCSALQGIYDFGPKSDYILLESKSRNSIQLIEGTVDFHSFVHPQLLSFLTEDLRKTRLDKEAGWLSILTFLGTRVFYLLINLHYSIMITRLFLLTIVFSQSSHYCQHD